MAFQESPRFPDEVSAWLVGGEEFMTDIVQTQGGFEQRNQVWAQPLRRYRLSNALRTIPNATATKAFFRAVGGRANGFRVKDLFDYTVDATTGLLGSGVGTGLQTYQLQKQYVNGATTSISKIVKPVPGQVSPFRNGVAVTAGGGAGQYSVDTTTGIVTFTADASSAASVITPGAQTQVTLAANCGLIAGKLLFLNGFAGADAGLLNGLAHTIVSVTGAGPYVFTLATNTNAKAITLGAGTGYAYPQASDALVWVGQFDIPVRFDMDWLQVGIDTGLMLWDNITMVELRL